MQDSGRCGSGICKNLNRLLDKRRFGSSRQAYEKPRSRRAQVKASGGIRDLKTVQEMIKAGADRIGASASVAIMKEYKETQE